MDTLQIGLAGKIIFSWLGTMFLIVPGFLWRYYNTLPRQNPITLNLYVFLRIAVYILFFLGVEIGCWFSVAFSERLFEAGAIIFVMSVIMGRFAKLQFERSGENLDRRNSRVLKY